MSNEEIDQEIHHKYVEYRDAVQDQLMEQVVAALFDGAGLGRNLPKDEDVWVTNHENKLNVAIALTKVSDEFNLKQDNHLQNRVQSCVSEEMIKNQYVFTNEDSVRLAILVKWFTPWTFNRFPSKEIITLVDIFYHVVLQYGDNVTTALEALRSISNSISDYYFAIPHTRSISNSISHYYFAIPHTSIKHYEQLALLNCLDNGDMHQKKLVCEIITNVLMKEAESGAIYTEIGRTTAEVLAQSLKKNGFLDILEPFQTETMRWFGLAMMCIETNGTLHTSPPQSPHHGN